MGFFLLFIMYLVFNLVVTVSYDGLKEVEIAYIKRNIKNYPPKKGIAQVVSDQKGDEGAYAAPEHNASNDPWIFRTDCVPEIKDTIESGNNLDSHPHPEQKDDNFSDKHHVVFSDRNDIFCEYPAACSRVYKKFQFVTCITGNPRDSFVISRRGGLAVKNCVVFNRIRLIRYLA
ncbi:hypothetical protein GMJAKD_04735 [Candidatus Electrothrix aarhusensis]